MKTDIRPRYFVSSSEKGKSIVFVTRAEHDAYESEAVALLEKHRAVIREKYGIYASTQGVFVTDESDLNEWDGKEYL